MICFGMATVLVIDDDPGFRDVLGRFLASLGAHVCSAGDGAEGLAVLATGVPLDLILLDLDMPVMGGREFLDARRAEPAWAAIPAIVLSGASRRGPVAGAAAVVGKGDPLDILLDVLGRFLPLAGRDTALAAG